MTDAFVVHRLRAKPVSYSVQIDHFVSGGEWQISVSVRDVVEDDIQRQRLCCTEAGFESARAQFPQPIYYLVDTNIVRASEC